MECTYHVFLKCTVLYLCLTVWNLVLDFMLLLDLVLGLEYYVLGFVRSADDSLQPFSNYVNSTCFI